jgi:phage repressor protein C with HTH and peptisase S24 domain
VENAINDRVIRLIETLDISQNSFAKALGTSSSRISNITTGRNRPDAEILGKIAEVYRNVSTKWLLTGKGPMFLEESRGNLKGNLLGNPIVAEGNDSYTKKVTPIIEHVIDTSGHLQIPIVDVKAAAGPGYINSEHLTADDVIRMPAHLVKSGHHLCIRIKGTSMAPTLQDGGYAIIRLLERSEWLHMPSERIYLVVDNDGKTAIKRVKNRFSVEKGFIVLSSDSPDKSSHPTYNLHPEEIAFIWYVEWYFTAKMPNVHDQYYNRVSQLQDSVDQLSEEVRSIKKQLK